mgnify:CR=1 FL=1|tara:strand:+ start:285 stop:1118 length:834 start_codon:yes stop_codon:yes gene_type:complete
MGTPTVEADPDPPQQTLNESADFSFVVPSEFVELPSQGRLYPQGHPLYNQATIEIKQMTAREEDMLTSRALLKKGIAIDRVLQSLIRDNRVQASKLLIGDRNAIMIAARISAYGNVYSTTVTCPACSTSQTHAFDLNTVSIYDGAGLDISEGTDNGDGTITTRLPRLGVDVTIRLMSGEDESAYIKRIEAQRKNRQMESAVTAQLYQMIVGVNGTNDRSIITKLIENMPSLDVRHLQYVFKMSTPNVDLTQHFECNECDHEEEMEVPLTADFFWPDL